MIKIKKNPNGDTRTAPDGITFEQFADANNSHITDVMRVMHLIAKKIDDRSGRHDYTKKVDEKLFYDEFLKAKTSGESFTDMSWFKMHIKKERHHPLSYEHPDFNIVDLIEMIADCVCAGLARSGGVRPLELPDGLLKRAVDNTVELLVGSIEVVEDN